MFSFHDIAADIPLALTLALILGAFTRALSRDTRNRHFGTAAVALLVTLLLWSYAAPVNLAIWAVLAFLGVAAAIGAALVSSKRLLLIEPIVFPICLITVVMVDTWF